MTKNLYFGNKMYSVRESHRIFYDGLRTFGYAWRGRRSGVLDKQFMERLMLAVTEVNGCALCAWGHAKAALESGMSSEEIRLMLAGEIAQVPAGEVPAVLFAQHYADSGGRPSREVWQRVVDIYGRPKALAILGAIRMIMIGNAYGIAGGALLSRLRGRPDPRSGLLYELGMLASLLLAPVTLLQAAWSSLLRKPLLRFPPAISVAKPA